MTKKTKMNERYLEILRWFMTIYHWVLIALQQWSNKRFMDYEDFKVNILIFEFLYGMDIRANNVM
ncbi:MAG: hypothetical protein ACXADU_15080 [Promethearchaeota archaeon]